jgi:invasion protein IalB
MLDVTLDRKGSRGMRATGLALAMLVTFIAPALAQPRPAAPPAAPPVAAGEAPERTTAQFGDWTVQCVSRAAPATGRICEMALSVQNQQQQLVAVLALGRLAPNQPFRLVARVPVNVSVAQAARLVAEGGEPVAMPFRNCLATSCFAEAELRDDALLRRLRARPADQAGRVEWRDAGGGETGFPVSFRGFTAAFEALTREPG